MEPRFEAFGVSHLVMLGLFVVLVPVVVVLGRRARATEREQRSRRVFAVGIVATAVPLQVLQLLPGDWDFETSLPLQLCDLAWLVAVYGLWTRAPWACALTYYWGLTLTTQAMLTPALVQDFPHPRYLGFWLMHLLVVWAAIYLSAGLGVRPTWRRYGLTVGVTAVWMVAVMVFNTAYDTNYGYLNAKPSTGSVLDLLGPWPWYVLTEIVVVAVVWALITLPWTRSGTPRRPLPSRDG